MTPFARLTSEGAKRMRAKLWGAKVGVGVLAAALAATACSSSSSGKGSSSGATAPGVTTTEIGNSGASAPGVTATDIRVAGIEAKLLWAGAEVGAQARFNRENAAGGVYGRKIDLVETGDDKLDPTTDVQETKRILAQDNIFAVVPIMTIAFQGGTYLDQQQVPFFGWGISPSFCGTKWGFGITGCVVQSDPKLGTSSMPVMGAKLLNKPANTLAMAQIAEATAAASGSLAVVKDTATRIGMKTAYSAAPIPAPPATVGDFTPYVQAIMHSNNGGPPDFVVLLLASPSNILGMQKGLQNAGYTGPIINTLTYSPQLVAASKGGTVYVQAAPLEAASTTPPVAQMVSDIQKLQSTPITLFEEYDYWQADMFIQALKATGPNLTRASLEAAAEKMTYYVKDTIGPTAYPAASEQPGVCGDLVTSNGTSYDISLAYNCATVK
jgi:ABC-type branched-subunit amino acid transport system substrate-binding protein